MKTLGMSMFVMLFGVLCKGAKSDGCRAWPEGSSSFGHKKP